MDEKSTYNFLEEKALELGCEEAKIIPADKVAVENRVRLKCMVGCPTYGTNLRCPPYTPSVEEFRRIVSDYSYAMVVTFIVPDLSTVERVDFSQYYRDKLNVLLEIERTAFNHGYNFTTGFFAGSCKLCEECNVNGECINPISARFSAESMGINVFKTAKNAGIELKFDTENVRSTMTLVSVVLVD